MSRSFVLTLTAIGLLALSVSPARAHEVNAGGRVLTVDPLFDHSARPRNELGIGLRLLSEAQEGGDAIQRWGLLFTGEAAYEGIFSVGVRALLAESYDFPSASRDTTPVGSFDLHVAFSAMRIGFPWRVLVTPALVGGAIWRTRSDAREGTAPEVTDLDPFAMVEVRIALGIDTLPWLSFAIKQGLELSLVDGTAGIALRSTYGVAFAISKRFSAMIEADSRLGRAPGATTGPVQERLSIGPGFHFAPVQGWRVDLGVRFPLFHVPGFGWEAMLGFRREFFSKSW